MLIIAVPVPKKIKPPQSKLLQNTYSRILLVDSSSVFNTISPQQLGDGVQLLQVGADTCNKSLDFLTEEMATVTVGRGETNHRGSGY